MGGDLFKSTVKLTGTLKTNTSMFVFRAIAMT